MYLQLSRTLHPVHMRSGQAALLTSMPSGDSYVSMILGWSAHPLRARKPSAARQNCSASQVGQATAEERGNISREGSPARRKIKACAVISRSEKGCWVAVCLELSMCRRKLPGASARGLRATDSALCSPALTLTSTLTGSGFVSTQHENDDVLAPKAAFLISYQHAVSFTELELCQLAGTVRRMPPETSRCDAAQHRSHHRAQLQRRKGGTPAARELRASFMSLPTTPRSLFLASEVCASKGVSETLEDKTSTRIGVVLQAPSPINRRAYANHASDRWQLCDIELSHSIRLFCHD